MRKGPPVGPQGSPGETMGQTHDALAGWSRCTVWFGRSALVGCLVVDGVTYQRQKTYLEQKIII